MYPDSDESATQSEDSQFYEACSKGNLVDVKYYVLQPEFNIHLCDEWGSTGFHCACRGGHVNVVKFFIEQGFNLNTSNFSGETGFISACIFGKLNVIKYLFNEGADWAACDSERNNGFYWACSGCHFNVIQFFLKNEYEEINFENVHGITGPNMLVERKSQCNDEHLFEKNIAVLIEYGANFCDAHNSASLVNKIQYRVIEITFMTNLINEKWTGRIANAIIDFTMEPSTDNSLQNLNKFLK